MFLYPRWLNWTQQRMLRKMKTKTMKWTPRLVSVKFGGVHMYTDTMYAKKKF